MKIELYYVLNLSKFSYARYIDKHVSYITDYDSIIKSYYEANEICLNESMGSTSFYIKMTTYPISNINLCIPVTKEIEDNNLKNFKGYLESCNYAMGIIKNPALKVFNDFKLLANIIVKSNFLTHTFYLYKDEKNNWLISLKDDLDKPNINCTLDIDLESLNNPS